LAAAVQLIQTVQIPYLVLLQLRVVEKVGFISLLDQVVVLVVALVLIKLLVALEVLEFLVKVMLVAQQEVLLTMVQQYH